jgi:hypothetical protein
MTQKIVITKPGFNSLTETNPDNIIFSSDYNTLKYDIAGSSNIHIVGDNTLKTTTNTIAHNLGYAPFFIVCVDDFANGVANYAIVPYSNSTVVYTIKAEAWVNATNLYLKMTNKSDLDLTAHFYYKIFRNKLF